MNVKEQYLHCSDLLLENLKMEIQELNDIVRISDWYPEYRIENNGKAYRHQAAYNKQFETLFQARDWEIRPLLKDSPRLIGDFKKNLVFVEIQFGNSSTLYRDFYKFRYGLQNGLLSLAVLIVPNNEYDFFPNRPKSVQSMANFDLALRYFTVLPISVPTWIIGLLPGK